jgi:hypothetical protein
MHLQLFKFKTLPQLTTLAAFGTQRSFVSGQVPAQFWSQPVWQSGALEFGLYESGLAPMAINKDKQKTIREKIENKRILLNNSLEKKIQIIFNKHKMSHTH